MFIRFIILKYSYQLTNNRSSLIISLGFFILLIILLFSARGMLDSISDCYDSIIHCIIFMADYLLKNLPTMMWVSSRRMARLCFQLQQVHLGCGFHHIQEPWVFYFIFMVLNMTWVHNVLSVKEVVAYHLSFVINSSFFIWVIFICLKAWQSLLNGLILTD